VLLRGLDFDGLLFTLLDIAQQCMAHFEKRRGDVPMTLRVSRVMLLVASYHGLNQRELAELADFDPATFVGVLDRLESEGWIHRVSDPKDRRAHLIVLANRAEPLVDRIRTAIRSMMVDVLREVPGEERTSMLRNLQRISRSLSSGSAADSLEPAHRDARFGHASSMPRAELTSSLVSEAERNELTSIHRPHDGSP
jgi:DNA-binding MarR family transcriptional regulator